MCFIAARSYRLFPCRVLDNGIQDNIDAGSFCNVLYHAVMC